MKVKLLGNPFLNTTRSLSLLYSSGLNGYDFYDMIRNLIAFDGPTMILMKF